MNVSPVSRSPSGAAAMSRVILIHGSWHGGWCWHKIAPRLRALGHEVIAPDLPGHGRDDTPVAEVTLESCVDRILPLLSGSASPVMVVAHSRGGIVLSTLAERCPEKIACAVYLAAVLPANGQTVFDLLPDAGDSLLLPHMFQGGDGSWDMLREEAYDSALYADCSAEDIELCHQLLRPEPLAPSLTRMQLSADRYGRVRKVYIELLDDRAVPIAWQRRMQANGPCAEIRAIAASHSAYFSRPDELAAQLHEIALRL